MQKELQETLAQVTMYSKIGKYLSNKVMKYGKQSKTHHSSHNTLPNKEDYLKIKKSRSPVKTRRDTNHSLKKNELHPPVGYYNVNFRQVEKNPRLYNFQRSVAHFHKEKFHCQETAPVLHDYPESTLCQYRVSGFKELVRMPARDDMKGSIRKSLDDPHEKRFETLYDFKANDLGKTKVNMSKDLPRDNNIFKIVSGGEYQYDVKVPLKRLDTHLVPFNLVVNRDRNFMIDEKGISAYFSDAQPDEQRRMVGWKKMLPREKTGLLPAYMDKNINSRCSISQLNLKTLEMNCTQLKEFVAKPKLGATNKDKQNIQMHI